MCLPRASSSFSFRRQNHLRSRRLLFNSSALLHLFLLLPSTDALSASQKDCQANEVFLQCGSCEGSCKEPVIATCRKECKPPRCECQAKKGFVRAHDGACIPTSECATYKGAYFGVGSVVNSQGGANLNAPKTMLAKFQAAGGGAGRMNKPGELEGSSFPAGGGVAASGSDDKVSSAPAAGESVLQPPPSSSSAAAAPAASTTREPSPPSIRPPSAIHRTPLPPLQDQVIQTGLSPPVIIRPKGEEHPISRSRMNLFADLANAGVTSEFGQVEETTPSIQAPAVSSRTSFHSVHHQQSALLQPQPLPIAERPTRASGESSVVEEGGLIHDGDHHSSSGAHSPLPLASLGDQHAPGAASSSGAALPSPGAEETGANPSAAKCGHRRCPSNALATGTIVLPDQKQQQQLPRRLKAKSQPYLYAYINPPVSLEEESSGGSAPLGQEVPPAAEQQQPEAQFEAEGVSNQMRISRAQPHQPPLIAPLPANLRIYKDRRMRMFRQRREVTTD